MKQFKKLLIITILTTATILSQDNYALSTNNESIISNQWRRVQQEITNNSKNRKKTYYREIVQILGTPNICRSVGSQLNCQWHEGKIKGIFSNQQLVNMKRSR